MARIHRLAAQAFVLSVFSVYLQAESTLNFTFTDFIAARQLHLVGDAAISGKVLRLAPAHNDTAGAAWFPERQIVGGGFKTEFQFQLTGQGGLGRGADGLAFVLQNSGANAIAGIGSAGGFAIGNGNGDLNSPGIPRSIAIFFDTYQNKEEGDPSNNSVSICTHGKIGEMLWPPPRLAMNRKLKINLKDGKVHRVRILYEPPLMRIFLDDPAVPVLSSTVDLSPVIDADASAYVGFTASTGGGWENHDVLTWSFASGPKPDVSSNLSIVSSNISFLTAACLPDRNLCTPERAVIESRGSSEYHIVLPANLEWGATIPNPKAHPVELSNSHGIVCWDVRTLGARGCGGPSEALVFRTRQGRTEFSIKDRAGAFRENEGYFEFDVRIR